MQLEMIPCPKCGNDFPKKRKELGYHVCISCSTVKPVVGVTTVEGSGDHTYNDIIIMEVGMNNSIKVMGVLDWGLLFCLSIIHLRFPC